MSYPLRDWVKLPRGYKFGQKTDYNSFHIGLDIIVPEGTSVLAPFDGEVVAKYTEKQTPMAGNCVYLKVNRHGKTFIIRFLHLEDYTDTRLVKQGDIIAHTGNTGHSSGSHLHVDVSRSSFLPLNRNNFVDPETFDWEDTVDAYNTRAGKLIAENPDLNRFLKYVFERTFQGFREKGFDGNVDSIGVRADVDRVMKALYNGVDFEAREVIKDYFNSVDFNNNWGKKG